MTEQQQRVNGLIERVERHQAALRLKDYPFAARYQRHLGSGKSWVERLKARNWKELGLRLDKWEKKLNAFVAEIEGSAGGAEFFDALPITRYVACAYDLLQGQRNDRRCALLIGPTGVGKSVALQRLAQQHPRDVAYLRFWPGHLDSLRRQANAIANVTGAALVPGAARTFENIIETLRGSPMTLIIEDIHEGGVLAFKLVKTLIDETRAKFFLSSYPTAYRKLVNGSTSAMSEAQQLLGRTLKPVNQQWLRGVGVNDVTVYLEQAVDFPHDLALVCAKNIAQAVRSAGNFRGLADAVETARINADENNEDLSPEYIEAALAELCKKSGDEEGGVA